MAQREVVIKGGSTNTSAKVTGQEELLVRIGSIEPGITPAVNNTYQAIVENLIATSSTTPPGLVSITIENVGAGVGTVNSVGQLPAGKSVTFTAPLGSTLGTIELDASLTSFLVSYIKL